MPARIVKALIVVSSLALGAEGRATQPWLSLVEEPVRIDAPRVIRNGLCTAHEDVFFTRSSHPGGNPRGRLNEDQGGRGMRCYIDDRETLYIGLGTMVDSKHGDEFHFGLGKRYLTPELFGFRLAVGGEISYVNYEIRNRVLLTLRNGKLALQDNAPGLRPALPVIHAVIPGTKRGLLPTLHLGIYYQVSKDVFVGYSQIYLPGGIARLTALVSSACQTSDRSLLMSQRPYDGGLEVPLSGHSFPKQLFLCYRF